MTKITKLKQCPHCEVIYTPLLADQEQCWNCADGYHMDLTGHHLLPEPNKIVLNACEEYGIDVGPLLEDAINSVSSYIVERFDPAHYELN